MRHFRAIAQDLAALKPEAAATPTKIRKGYQVQVGRIFRVPVFITGIVPSVRKFLIKLLQ